MAESEANDFASMIEAKAEHSKFGALISSIVAGNNDGFELLSLSDNLNFMHLDKIDFASVSSTQVGKPKTISAYLISKIWNIANITATKVLDQNTQLNSQGANKDLSRQFSTTDGML